MLRLRSITFTPEELQQQQQQQQVLLPLVSSEMMQGPSDSSSLSLKVSHFLLWTTDEDDDDDGGTMSSAIGSKLLTQLQGLTRHLELLQEGSVAVSLDEVQRALFITELQVKVLTCDLSLFLFICIFSVVFVFSLSLCLQELDQDLFLVLHRLFLYLSSIQHLQQSPDVEVTLQVRQISKSGPKDFSPA